MKTKNSRVGFLVKIMVTGGAGFIGSNFLNLSVPSYPDYNFINADKLTYAANLENLEQVNSCKNYQFKQCDIADFRQVEELFQIHNPDLLIHFAAESHVDRSILGPAEFIQSNIIGTFNLLEVCRKNWHKGNDKLFLHVSTDEVYGSLGPEGYFTETTAYDPSSPYSASKAASDHLVRAYHRTYGLPAIITNCSNNYGPYQFPEKLIPLMILNALEGKPLPVYGKGENVRDWLYVEDHCRALWSVLEKGRPGETYNIGGSCEWRNIDIVNQICDILASELNSTPEQFNKLITYVPDRPGHDLRYAIDASKIQNELNWYPQETFDTGLRKTIRWYLDNKKWVKNVQSGDYKKWIEINYRQRG
jgi:dTDP-glucose 4,6-dehydratase